MLPILAGILIYFAMVRAGTRVGALVALRRPNLIRRRPDGRRTRGSSFWVIFAWAWLSWACALSLSLVWTYALPAYPLGPLDALLCLACGAMIQVTAGSLHRHRAQRQAAAPSVIKAAPAIDSELAAATRATDAADLFGSARHFADTVQEPGFLEAWLAFDERAMALEHLIRTKELARITIPEPARVAAQNARIRLNMLRLAALEAGVMDEVEITAAEERRRSGAAVRFTPVVETGRGF